MGGIFSRQVAWGSYEKGFEKIEKETKKIQEARAARRKWILAYISNCFSLFLITAVACVAHVVWVQRQPPGTFTVQQHLVRSGVSVALPMVVWLVYGFLRGLLVFLEGRDDRRMKKLVDSKNKMIQELKDITLFDKTLDLIKKYDPKPQPVKVVHVPTEGAAAGRNMPNGAGAKSQNGSSNMVLGTAAAAGKALLPMLDHLAKSLIGDNPQLLDEIKKAQIEAKFLKDENELLRQELSMLRAQLDYPPQDEGKASDVNNNSNSNDDDQAVMSTAPKTLLSTAQSGRKGVSSPQNKTKTPVAA